MTDSDDTHSDGGKRKAGSWDDVFRKSKKTSRSPKKGDDSNPDMLTQMMDLLKVLAEDTKEIKNQQKKQAETMNILTEELKELKEEQKEYRREMGELKLANEKAMEEINQLQNELSNTNKRLQKLEGEKRRRNIVIQGLPIDTDNPNMLKNTVGGFIEKELGVKVKVNDARKLGDKTCLVELDNKYEKSKVMQNKMKLNQQKEKIYVNDDLTKDEREIQAKIRIMAREQKSKGKITKIGYQRLIVNNELWKWNKEKRQLEKIKADISKN